MQESPDTLYWSDSDESCQFDETDEQINTRNSKFETTDIQIHTMKAIANSKPKPPRITTPSKQRATSPIRTTRDVWQDGEAKRREEQKEDKYLLSLEKEIADLVNRTSPSFTI
jgi:hypothetical protein